MKNTKKVVSAILVAVFVLMAAMSVLAMSGCDFETSTSSQEKEVKNTYSASGKLISSQPTPTDIEYSLERYNLMRRAYWVNGMREKAMTLVCPVEKPLGYVVLFAGNAVLGSFVVDGKITSLNSYLTPDSEYFELVTGSTSTYVNRWIADIDGSFGANDNGIFFFTPDGKYIEWNGTYLYSDIPFTVNTPVLTIAEE
jgi:hypothetical protein